MRPLYLACDEIGITRSVITLSLKQWLAMFTLLIIYILLGGTFYYLLEGNMETETRLQEYNEGLELQGELFNKYE